MGQKIRRSLQLPLCGVALGKEQSTNEFFRTQDVNGKIKYTYAYRLIWNEICDELVRNTRLVLKEQSADMIEITSTSFQSRPDPLDTLSLRYTLQQAKQQAHGGAAKGIQCLELIAQGYSSQEVGNISGADSGTVRMWMTRARKYLKGFPELHHYAEVI